MSDLMNDLYAYNDWANGRVLSLCEGLSDDQLDSPREMGFGTLRATLYHLLTAEVVWLERWKSMPWRTFPTDPGAISVAEISDGLAKVAAERKELIDQQSDNHWSGRITFLDSKKASFKLVLKDLLMHVANHGVHHRAQALNYLKQYDRTVVAGIDYIFYRLAEHSVEQAPESLESLTGYGLSVSEPNNENCPWDAAIATRFFQYHDWAIGKILDFASDLSDESLDRDFQMGPGSIRQTVLHLFDAEQWWVGNWNRGPHPFPQSEPGTTIQDLRNQWQQVAADRDAVIAGVTDQEAQRIVEVLAGGPPTRFRVGESMIHLAIHGTHHRAQLINMFRHVQAPWENVDLLYALDQLPTS